MKEKDVKRIVTTILAGIYAVVSLYPLIWMVFQSLKSDLEFYKNQYSIPVDPKWNNYLTAWQKANLSGYYKNSVIVTAASIIIGVLVCALAAYAFSKLKFVGKKTLSVLLVIVLFLPSPMLVFPVYLICRDIGILNSYSGLVGPYVCGIIPLSMLILTSAFDGIPKELSEAAKIDGCNDYVIWWKIMMPLIKSSIATVSILAFLNVWNEYMWALVSISDKKLFTLPVGIVDLGSKVFTYGYGPVFAGMVMTTVPIIVFYISLQDQFVKAISAGAVKG